MDNDTMILTMFMVVLGTISMVAGDANAHKTTCMANASAIRHLHLMVQVFIVGNVSVHSNLLESATLYVIGIIITNIL